MENTLQGFNSRANEEKDQISYLRDREAKDTQSEQQKEKQNSKNEDSLSNLQDDFKSPNMCIMGCWKERESKELKTHLEKKIPNPVKEIDIKVQDAQRIPKKMNPKRPRPRQS